MTKLNVVILLHKRFWFSEVMLKIFAKCKDLDFHLILSHHPMFDISKQVELAKELELPFEDYVTVDGNNYLDRIKRCISLNGEYSMKLDEDVIFSESVFRFIYNNLNILDDENNLLLSPALCGGIPSVDHFIDSNFSEEEKKELHSIFSNARVDPGLWGSSFHEVNRVMNESGYIPERYWYAVKQTPHYYKGIHPVRHDANSQRRLNEIMMSHIHKFNEDRDYEIVEMTEPYFCNSAFAIKTDLWKTIIYDQSLFKDAFDEVAINKYRDGTQKKMLVIKNSFGIHMMYNTVADRMGDNYEQNLFEQIKSKIL